MREAGVVTRALRSLISVSLPLLTVPIGAVFTSSIWPCAVW